MAIIDHDKPLIPLSSLADTLNTKQRTLKMYEDKGLLPKSRENVKKFYSFNDVKKIAFVHYLASVKRVNANGIRFINEILQDHVDSKEYEKILNTFVTSLEQTPKQDIHEIDNM